MRGIGQRLSVRLISVAIGLVMIVAQTSGAQAHAKGHHHHSRGAGSAVQHFHPEPPSAESAPAHDEASAAVSGAGQLDEDTSPGEPGSPGSHADCGDFMCHGGHAIVGATDFLLPRLQSATPIRPFWHASATPSLSLERPPRTSLFA